MWRIVNYWSEWCVPCRREIPVLNELNAQLAASGSNVTVVGVDFDENPRDEALAIALRMGIEFPTLTIDMIRQLQMTAPNVLPTTYVLSPDNQVVAKMIGEQTKLSLLTQLEELKLAGPPD
jgi:thiol-disulfide isomerase/thioredoxin